MFEEVVLVGGMKDLTWVVFEVMKDLAWVVFEVVLVCGMKDLT